MKGKKIIIKRVGNVYIFQVNTAMRKEDLKKLHDEIKQQIQEGCVLLPANVELVDVEPYLKTFIE